MNILTNIAINCMLTVVVSYWKKVSKACSGTTSNPIIQPMLAEYIVCASLTKLLTLEIVSDREGNCHNLYCPCNNVASATAIQVAQKNRVKVFGLGSRMVMFRKRKCILLKLFMCLSVNLYISKILLTYSIPQTLYCHYYV